ncbi:MAG: ABC transporter permease subunit [Acinetobacter sp.]
MMVKSLPSNVSDLRHGRKHWLDTFVRYREAYLLFIPIVIWFVLFCYVPMGGMVIAFKKFSVIKGIAESPWVGFSNFHKLFAMESFWQAFRNTLIISAQRILIAFPLPILFALLLNELKQVRFKKLVQTVSYLPHFISWPVAGGMIYMLLSPSSGPINGLITLLGGEAQNFIGISKYFRPILLLSHIWKSLGWSAIVYLAAVTAVDEQLYEAAYMDGAGRFRRIWHITLPGIRSTVSVMLIMEVGRLLNVSFDQTFMLINDMVLSVGETLDYFVYRVGLYSTNNFSIATATGMIKSVIGLVLVVLTNMISKKITDGEGIW